MAAPVRALLVLLVLAFLVGGIIDVLRNFEDNQCEMTWMYEQPEISAAVPEVRAVFLRGGKLRAPNEEIKIRLDGCSCFVHTR